MTKFIFAYHGGKQFDSKEQGQAHMGKWMAWNEGLGSAVVDPGWPVGPSKTVSSEGVVDNGGSNPLSGITVIQAESMEAAMLMAKSCPHIDIGGSIEVAEAFQMMPEK